MKRLKIPQGVYTLTFENEYDYAHISHNGNMCLLVEPEFSDFHVEDEPNNLVTIAHDSITTYNKCGKLTSELLEQNKELIEALKNLKDANPNDTTRNYEASWSKAYALLSKIENNQ